MVMRRPLMLAAVAVLALSSGGCVSAMGQATPPDPASYAAVLAEPSYPADERARDAARHTVETLAFAEVRPGQKITDMIMGGGYFTRVFAAAVGPQGHVTAWQPAEFIAFQASYKDAVDAADAMANIRHPFADRRARVCRRPGHDLHGPELSRPASGPVRDGHGVAGQCGGGRGAEAWRHLRHR